MASLFAHLSPRSGNTKTGPIPVSTSSASTCPVACPHRDTTCYASLGKLSLWWRKVTTGMAGGSWPRFLEAVRSIKAGALWRHNQAGDLPGDGVRIDREALRALVEAQAGRKGFTYTHYLHGARGDVALHKLSAVREALAGGFTVNASAESLAEADTLKALGLPVAVVVATDHPEHSRTPEGRAVRVCPAQVRDEGPGSSCDTCGMCAMTHAGRPIVAFRAHGARKATIDKRLTLFAAEGVSVPAV